MKQQLTSFLAAASILFSCQSSRAQGVAINTDGSTADGSAMLDIKSTTQGMLVPRMDSASRSIINAPATGLLVYQTDGLKPGFYFYNGSVWTSLISGGAAGGDLTGTYPNPTVANNAITTAKLADSAVTIAKINTTSGTASSTTFLCGNGTWATPVTTVFRLSSDTSSANPGTGTTMGYSITNSPGTLANTSGSYVITTSGTVVLPSNPVAGTQINILVTTNNVKINTNGKSVFDLNGAKKGLLGYISPGTYKTGESSPGAGDAYFTNASMFVYDGMRWDWVCMP